MMFIILREFYRRCLRPCREKTIHLDTPTAVKKNNNIIIAGTKKKGATLPWDTLASADSADRKP